MAATIRIGISGWRYPPWRGVFYPAGLAQRRELHFASRLFPSIELNGSFYGLQSPKSYLRWRRETPEDFLFSIKGNRHITHERRLRDVATPLAGFFASGLFHLREKLGPVLWQLPPSLKYDPIRLAAFFRLLPGDTAAALALARRRERSPGGRTRLAIDESRPLRHCLEVRHPSFLCESFVGLLQEHRIGLVVADTAGRWPYAEDVTSDFVYIRLHGGEQLYTSGYADAALDHWAARIRAWSAGGEPAGARRIGGAAAPRREGRDVYCYFDNSLKVRAPFDARRLLEKLGLEQGREGLLELGL